MSLSHADLDRRHGYGTVRLIRTTMLLETMVGHANIIVEQLWGHTYTCCPVVAYANGALANTHTSSSMTLTLLSRIHIIKRCGHRWGWQPRALLPRTLLHSLCIAGCILERHRRLSIQKHM